MAAHPKQTQTSAQRRVRVRSRRLDEIDEAKIAVALALMARRLVEQERSERNGRPPAGEAT